MSNSRRSSLSGSPNSLSQLTGSTQDLKHRVIACLNKLADRDTLSIAAAELDSIAGALSLDLFSSFLACIHATDDSAKSPVRRHCVSVLAVLSESHGEALSPHLARMVATLLRRLRDPDSAVRAACVAAAAAMSARITRPPFAAAFARPLVEAMATEQDGGAQAAAAMCLAAAIEAAPDPDAAQLRRSLPRIGKLARSEAFKAKAAALGLIGSIISAGGASSAAVLDWLVPAVVEFLSSEDWAVRKAAAETLGRVAAVEKSFAESYRDSCLAALENRRFDKVKVVRETMNHTLELWKEVCSDQIPSPTKSRSSQDNGMTSCFPPLSKTHQDPTFKTPSPHPKKQPTTRSPISDSDGASSSSSSSSSLSLSRRNSVKKVSPTPTENVGRQKKKPPPLDWKVEIAVPRQSNGGPHKSGGGVRSGSRVVPFDYDEKLDEEVFEKESEDLNLIREQLLQIENQQSSLFDLLQRFIGSSQSGLNSLETRVNGIEIALEEMSYNLAVSTGRISSTESADNTCCKLPGADFLSSKFWRRADVGRYSSSQRLSDGRRCHHQNGSLFSAETNAVQEAEGVPAGSANEF